MTELKKAEVAYWDKFIDNNGIDKAYENIPTATSDIKESLLRSINKYHEKQQDKKNSFLKTIAVVAALSAAASAFAALFTMTIAMFL